MSLYFTLKKSYKVLPKGFRHALYLMTPDPLKKLRSRVVEGMEDGANHDEIYDSTYYAEKVEPSIQLSAEQMADTIIRDFSPRTIADMGCGTGTLLAALRERGAEVQGFEYSAAALKICHERGLDVVRYDIEGDPVPTARVDLVISTEVAEHLPESCADKYLEILTTLAPTVILTAATPGQPGNDHVNLQPNEYWIDKLEKLGFTFDAATTRTWRSEWEVNDVHWIYYHSIMVFQRR
ncbi:MAG: methyltransferase domain-containing protein [Verrucomicrobiota bacterium]